MAFFYSGPPKKKPGSATVGCKHKFKVIAVKAFLAQSKYGIEISDRGLRDIVDK